MVYVPIPHNNDGRKAGPHETAIALFIVAFIVLGFAAFVVTLGPKSGSPPPPIVLWSLAGSIAILALVAFFSWLKWQGEGNAPSQDSDSEEEK